MGAVPCEDFLLRFFCVHLFARVCIEVTEGEGEPGYEATKNVNFSVLGRLMQKVTIASFLDDVIRLTSRTIYRSTVSQLHARVALCIYKYKPHALAFNVINGLPHAVMSNIPQ